MPTVNENAFITVYFIYLLIIFLYLLILYSIHLFILIYLLIYSYDSYDCMYVFAMTVNDYERLVPDIWRFTNSSNNITNNNNVWPTYIAGFYETCCLHLCLACLVVTEHNSDKTCRRRLFHAWLTFTKYATCVRSVCILRFNFWLMGRRRLFLVKQQSLFVYSRRLCSLVPLLPKCSITETYSLRELVLGSRELPFEYDH